MSIMYRLSTTGGVPNLGCPKSSDFLNILDVYKRGVFTI